MAISVMTLSGGNTSDLMSFIGFYSQNATLKSDTCYFLPSGSSIDWIIGEVTVELMQGKRHSRAELYYLIELGQVFGAKIGLSINGINRQPSPSQNLLYHACQQVQSQIPNQDFYHHINKYSICQILLFHHHVWKVRRSSQEREPSWTR